MSAISEAFKILQTGVVDQQQREQIEAIKAQLTALEDGTPNGDFDRSVSLIANRTFVRESVHTRMGRETTTRDPNKGPDQ